MFTEYYCVCLGWVTARNDCLPRHAGTTERSANAVTSMPMT
jgi:hypothetical protein